MSGLATPTPIPTLIPRRRELAMPAPETSVVVERNLPIPVLAGRSASAPQQQLEALRVTVDLQVVDWATLVQHRNNPQMYDIFTTGVSFVPDPASVPPLRLARARPATRRYRSAWT